MDELTPNEEQVETPVEASPAAEAVASVESAPLAAGDAPAEEAAPLAESVPAAEAMPVTEAVAAEEAIPAEEAMPAEEAPVDVAADDAEQPAGEEVAAEVPEGAGEPAEPEPGVPGLDWYIIHTYSGFETKVRDSLLTRADAFGYGGRVGEILIPTEDVVEMRNGKKVTSKRLLYPGYALVQLDLDDELWHVVKNTPRVTGFVGGGQKPNPLSADEVNQILYRQTVSAESPRPKMSFAHNDQVKIIDGPFSNFTGSVEEVNEDRSTLKVMVTIFGRGTPVELEYFQVEKEG